MSPNRSVYLSLYVCVLTCRFVSWCSDTDTCMDICISVFFSHVRVKHLPLGCTHNLNCILGIALFFFFFGELTLVDFRGTGLCLFSPCLEKPQVTSYPCHRNLSMGSQLFLMNFCFIRFLKQCFIIYFL